MQSKNAIITICMLCLLFFIPCVALGEVVQTKNADGTVCYSVCTADGMQLHDPIPHEIVFAGDLYNDNGINIGSIYACYVDDDEHLAVYLFESNYFSGFVFQDVFQYSESLAVVGDLSYQYGYMDEQGNIVIPCQWRWAESFENGIAVVTYETSKEYASVWIDREGKIISLDPEYGYADE
jgi:hypothetical protein